METLVQAYLDIQGKIAEFRREIKALRVEEKTITANLFEAMGDAGVESIRISEDRYLVAEEKPKRTRSKQQFYQAAEGEGFTQEDVDRLMSLSRGAVTGSSSNVKIRKSAPARNKEDDDE
ncbi:hypothetical protein [Andrias davidianus ranavirus]|uniref:Uncharacterized protein n=2 Tax=Ranavirus TaxID=10492 RepID=T2C3W1_9VIRU|nr:hypothetical protein [Chinese giant salamander iridovirus]AGV20628.1 hypothetical protein [Andrias davidianus ranavirus]AHA42364.1 hypothetical protein [Andrias davidianus ranavirus]AHA80949.1 hypothetical protein [Chinese giant salamander iridovirus]UYY91500.1 hypothetical protein [Percocypris pingi ranavirus]